MPMKGKDFDQVAHSLAMVRTVALREDAQLSVDYIDYVTRHMAINFQMTYRGFDRERFMTRARHREGTQ